MSLSLLVLLTPSFLSLLSCHPLDGSAMPRPLSVLPPCASVCFNKQKASQHASFVQQGWMSVHLPAGPYRCSVCGVEVQGALNWQQHLEGTKHKKKVEAQQKGTAVAADTNSSTTINAASKMLPALGESKPANPPVAAAEWVHAAPVSDQVAPAWPTLRVCTWTVMTTTEPAAARPLATRPSTEAAASLDAHVLCLQGVLASSKASTTKGLKAPTNARQYFTEWDDKPVWCPVRGCETVLAIAMDRGASASERTAVAVADDDAEQRGDPTPQWSRFEVVERKSVSLGHLWLSHRGAAHGCAGVLSSADSAWTSSPTIVNESRAFAVRLRCSKRAPPDGSDKGGPVDLWVVNVALPCHLPPYVQSDLACCLRQWLTDILSGQGSLHDTSMCIVAGMLQVDSAAVRSALFADAGGRELRYTSAVPLVTRRALRLPPSVADAHHGVQRQVLLTLPAGSPESTEGGSSTFALRAMLLPPSLLSLLGDEWRFELPTGGPAPGASTMAPRTRRSLVDCSNVGVPRKVRRSATDDTAAAYLRFSLTRTDVVLSAQCPWPSRVAVLSFFREPPVSIDVLPALLSQVLLEWESQSPFGRCSGESALREGADRPVVSLTSALVGYRKACRRRFQAARSAESQAARPGGEPNEAPPTPTRGAGPLPWHFFVQLAPSALRDTIANDVARRCGPLMGPVVAPTDVLALHAAADKLLLLGSDADAKSGAAPSGSVQQWRTAWLKQPPATSFTHPSEGPRPDREPALAAPSACGALGQQERVSLTVRHDEDGPWFNVCRRWHDRLEYGCPSGILVVTPLSEKAEGHQGNFLWPTPERFWVLPGLSELAVQRRSADTMQAPTALLPSLDWPSAYLPLCVEFALHRSPPEPRQ